MDHIFGDSHDIAFGAKSPTPATPAAGPSHREATHTRKVHHDDFGDLESGSRPQEVHKPAPIVRPVREHAVAPRPPRPVRSETPERELSLCVHHDRCQFPEATNTPVLSRLIDGMKSSFLPREEDVSVLRMVILSAPDVTDPLILVTRDDTTVVLGSGFSTMNRAGTEYATFPDMRLIASEKTRLGAWILQDASIDVRPFQTILPAVGFPPIYATRDIIAKFRNNITDADFSLKMSILGALCGWDDRASYWRYRVESGCCIDTEVRCDRDRICSLCSSHASGEQVSPDTNTGYILTRNGLQSRQVRLLSFKGTDMKRHTMKFTFDTFFIDKNSVGVAAGYTLGDREQLAENGVLMFTLEEDTRARTIAGHIFIDSRGFVHAHEMMSVHKEVLKGIRATYEKLITENPKIDRGSLVQGLRRELTKYCYLLTGRTPVVMPILIER